MPPVLEFFDETDLGEILRSEIAEQEMSQYQLQRETGVSQAVLSRFLSGERDILLATATPLFDYLGLKVVRTKGKKKR